MQDGLDQIDAFIYINLEHRKDRRSALVSQLKHLNVQADKILRIEASFDILNGHRGCVKSHIQALELAKGRGYEKILILEDDALFIKTPKEINQGIATFFQEFIGTWDVFFLGAAIFEYDATHHPDYKKVRCAECAHSYIVHKNYYSTLIDCYNSSLALMEKDLDFSDSTFKALDQSWKKLQKKDNWFIGSMMTQQRRSYSDIEHRIKDREHLEYYL